MPYDAIPNHEATRRDRARQREDQVVVAAEACFQASGFHGTAMSQIARCAGLSVGQIYRHFENKDALIAKIVERNMQRTLALIEVAFASGDDKIDTLVAQVGPAVARAVDPARGRLMLEIAAEASRNPSMAAALQTVDRVGRERFRRLLLSLNDQALDAAEIEARVEVLSLLIEGLPWRLVRNPELNLDKFTAHVRAVMRDLLVKGAL